MTRPLPDNWLHKFEPLPQIFPVPVLADPAPVSSETGAGEALESTSNCHIQSGDSRGGENIWPTVEEQLAYWQREHDNDLRQEAILDELEQERIESSRTASQDMEENQ